MWILLWSVSVIITESSGEVGRQVLSFSDSFQARQLQLLIFHPQQHILYFFPVFIAVVEVSLWQWSSSSQFHLYCDYYYTHRSFSIIVTVILSLTSDQQTIPWRQFWGTFFSIWDLWFLLFLLTWRWRQQVPHKQQYPSTNLYGVISQKTVIQAFLFTCCLGPFLSHISMTILFRVSTTSCLPMARHSLIVLTRVEIIIFCSIILLTCKTHVLKMVHK
jgi:hypothetical protein